VDLLALTADLVAIPSVSRDEFALANRVESILRTGSALHVDRIGANVVARTELGQATRVVMAGHLDTVPANGNATPRLDGDTLWGLGSADMKGGLAVMLALATTVTRPTFDVTYVFYAGEEIAREHNGLLTIEAAAPDLLRADAAVLGEPTGALVEAGCQGVIKLDLEMGGARAHTARPWMGVNAIHRLAPVLEQISAYQARQPVIDGCQFREAVQVVAVNGGVAGNVVPDRATVGINHRFAPDRDVESASAWICGWLGSLVDSSRGDRLQVVEAQPAAAPSLDHPVLKDLLLATGAPPKPKLGWTDVAFFAERGIPAVNFGPGDPELAHTAGEQLEREPLDRAYLDLYRLLSGTVR
jgi:succinyl-diaminopimelate desuccinylase